jgi:histidyl-tRNA synthetase
MIILGEKELESKKILIKDCQKGQEFLVEKERLIENIIKILNLEL